jgi:hypothetical protein
LDELASLLLPHPTAINASVMTPSSASPAELDGMDLLRSCRTVMR